MEVRIAEYSDFEQIAHLHAQAWRNTFQGKMDDAFLVDEVEDDRRLIWQTRMINPPINQHVILLEDNDQVVGFACAFGNHDFERGTIIESIVISPEYQSQDLDLLLMRELTAWMNQYFSDSGVYIEALPDDTSRCEHYKQIGASFGCERVWHAPCGDDILESIFVWASPKSLGVHLA